MNTTLKKITLLSLILISNLLQAKISLVNELKPLPKHKKESQLIVTLMEQFNYKDSKLNDELSSKILDNYVETLDPNKMYFLSSDILAFDKIQYALDEAIKEGQIEPAYKIYNLYNQRVQERAQFALALLEKPFDFNLSEDYAWDREEQPWAMNNQELDELWRKRVKNDYLGLKLTEKADDEIIKTLTKRYQLFSKRAKEAKSEDVFQYFINSYVSLVEPHTGYLAPRTSENFDINMSLSLEGIGAVLGEDGEYTIINSIVKGGPADMQGELKKGDKLLALGQGDEGPLEDVIGWRLDDVVQKVRGEKGSTIRMLIRHKDDPPGAKPTQVNIVRDKVKLEQQAAQYKIIKVNGKDGEQKIGVIDLPTFYLDFDGLQSGDPDYRSTTKDVKKILNALREEKVDGLIVDLRNNGGGSLYEAEQLTGLFIEQGPIVQTKTSLGKVSVKSDRNPNIYWDGPMVVMVNRLSASASEIFAAALQDYGRAVIVGEQTFGKGTVQNMMPLNNYSNDKENKLGQLKMTIAQFFRINGGSTQNRGVIPDIQFPLAPGLENYGESTYENALPWTTIKPSRFDMFEDLSDEIPYLSSRFKEREKVNFEFEFLKREMELYEQEKDDKTVSLSLEERKRKTDDRKNREKQRKERRLAMLENNQNDLIASIDVLFDSAELEAKAEEPTDDEAEEGDEEEEFVDYKLHETARILGDFIKLNSKKMMAAAGSDKTDSEKN
ncbi:carboxy terminal-processing peptidase [Marinicella sp. W31]|uniref:carboxy terminal-processing peptidase n=1 Tax=Marinicella sp. W31 TaxID=3023713 RepID=UPI00375848E6